MGGSEWILLTHEHPQYIVTVVTSMGVGLRGSTPDGEDWGWRSRRELEQSTQSSVHPGSSLCPLELSMASLLWS